MELRQVRAVHALAAHRHFGRAAREVGVTQSSLSQSLRALETEIGVSLFERTTRSVAITRAGQDFVDQTRPALTMLEVAIARAQAAGRGEAGSLVVGLLGSALTPPLPELLRRFRERRPEVVVSVRELTTSQQVEGLLDGSVDVGLLRPPVPAPLDRELVLTTVLREPLVAALPRRHRLAHSASLSVRSLAAEPFVRTPRALGVGFHDHVTALCRAAGFVPETVQEADQMSSVLGLVAAGFGVSIVPARARVPGVALVPLIDRRATVDLALAVPRRRPVTPQARLFTDLVSTLAGGVGTPGRGQARTAEGAAP